MKMTLSFLKKLVRKLTDRHVPLFLIFITLAQLGFFIYYSIRDPDNPAPMDSIFILSSDKRKEIWRFLSYMMLHSNYSELGYNLFVQMIVGLPMEMVHGTWRVVLIYMLGVLTVSLGMFVSELTYKLTGASGGIYALLAAQLTGMLLNYKKDFATDETHLGASDCIYALWIAASSYILGEYYKMPCCIIKLIITVIAVCNMGYEIYSGNGMIHIFAASVGLIIGLVLKKIEKNEANLLPTRIQ